MDNNLFNSQKYEAVIKKIQRMESILVNVTRVLTIIIIIMILPLKITLPTGKTLINYSGISPVIAFLLIAFCYAAELFLHSKLIAPKLTAPLTVECDPEKYLAINMATARPHIFKLVCITGYVYLGNYNEVIRCANDVITHKNPKYVLTALYHRAYAEFLSGNYTGLKNTVADFSEKLSQNPKTSEKFMAEWEGGKTALELLTAIADNDVARINELKDRIRFNGASKASEVIVRYTKGIAESAAGDIEAARTELVWVKENATKTVFSSLANEKLESIEG